MPTTRGRSWVAQQGECVRWPRRLLLVVAALCLPVPCPRHSGCVDHVTSGPLDILLGWLFLPKGRPQSSTLLGLGPQSPPTANPTTPQDPVPGPLAVWRAALLGNSGGVVQGMRAPRCRAGAWLPRSVHQPCAYGTLVKPLHSKTTPPENTFPQATWDMQCSAHTRKCQPAHELENPLWPPSETTRYGPVW